MEIFVQPLLQISEIDSHMHAWKSFEGMAPKSWMLTGFYFIFSPPKMAVSKWKDSSQENWGSVFRIDNQTQ